MCRCHKTSLRRLGCDLLISSGFNHFQRALINVKTVVVVVEGLHYTRVVPLLTTMLSLSAGEKRWDRIVVVIGCYRDVMNSWYPCKWSMFWWELWNTYYQQWILDLNDWSQCNETRKMVVRFRNEVSTVTGSLNRMVDRYCFPAHYMVVLEFVMWWSHGVKLFTFYP